MTELPLISKQRLSLGVRVVTYSLLFLLLAWWGGRVAYDRTMQQLHVEGTDRLLNSIGQLRRTLPMNTTVFW
jgi:C4-dicarboxylate-specific signal transduction histidine kinase